LWPPDVFGTSDSLVQGFGGRAGTPGAPQPFRIYLTTPSSGELAVA